MINFKKFIFSLAFCLAIFNDAKSLNSFEFALLGIGTAFVADQYFDTSLNESNTFELKNEVVQKFYENQRNSVANDYFKTLPIQEQLLLIEELEKNF